MNVPWPGPPGRQALVLKLAVGLQHRVRVDGQRGDHVPDLGKLVTRLEVAKPQRVLDLLHELQVGRHPRVRVEPELDRAVPFIYCHRTRLQDDPARPPLRRRPAAESLALFCSRAFRARSNCLDCCVWNSASPRRTATAPARPWPTTPARRSRWTPRCSPWCPARTACPSSRCSGPRAPTATRRRLGTAGHVPARGRAAARRRAAMPAGEGRSRGDAAAAAARVRQARPRRSRLGAIGRPHGRRPPGAAQRADRGEDPDRSG